MATGGIAGSQARWFWSRATWLDGRWTNGWPSSGGAETLVDDRERHGCQVAAAGAASPSDSPIATPTVARAAGRDARSTSPRTMPTIIQIATSGGA